MAFVDPLDVVDIASKTAALRSRKEQEVKIAKRIDSVIAQSVGEDEMPRYCGVCSLFGRRRPRRVATSDTAEKETSETSARLFGTRVKAMSSQEKLSAAVASMGQRAEDLSDRAQLSRSKAATLMRQQRKAEAMQELKRCKALEKQAATAKAAMLTLEQQADLIAESQLQREVAQALSASVKSVKKKTKGLLGATEAAVDDTADVRDMAEEMNSVMEGLAPANVVDEDELYAELEQLVQEQAGEGIAASSAAAACAPSAHASSTAASAPSVAHATEEVRLTFPSAPTDIPSSDRFKTPKKEEKAQLLAVSSVEG